MFTYWDKNPVSRSESHNGYHITQSFKLFFLYSLKFRHSKEAIRTNVFELKEIYTSSFVHQFLIRASCKVDVNSALGCLNRVNVSNVAEVAEMNAALIFRVGVCRIKNQESGYIALGLSTDSWCLRYRAVAGLLIKLWRTAEMGVYLHFESYYQGRRRNRRVDMYKVWCRNLKADPYLLTTIP
jgi:hypothetical protein